MKLWLFILLAVGVVSCSWGPSALTMHAFSEIPVGATTEEVVTAAGKPYAIHKTADGGFEYEYIERLKAQGRDIEERHYYFLIKDGKVVSKRVKQSSPPAYTFDSYEMQTTQHL